MFYEKKVKKYVTYPLFALGVGIAFSAHVEAISNQNIDAIKKDIHVISKIIESSTELKDSHSHPRVKGRYLADQGIVLNVRFPGSGHNLYLVNQGEFDFPATPDPEEINLIVTEAMDQAQDNWLENVAPMPPAPPLVTYTNSFDSDFTGFFSNSVPGKESKQMKAYRKAIKALRKEQRALAIRARKLAEKVRKLSNKEREKKFSSERKNLAKTRAELKARRKELNTRFKQIKLEQRKKRLVSMNQWKINVLDTFCEYAPLPRNLPKKEHLTFIFNHATFIGNKKADTIVVLNNSQLKECRRGKMNGTQLLKSAQQYDY